MNYTTSKYNFTYKRSLNENVIYNTFSKALVVLSDAEFEQFSNNNLYSEEIINTLVENRILIEDTFSETDFLKYFHYKTKFASDTLFLTIAPTMDCNFACPYCYENRRSGKMSEEVQAALIKYVEDTVKNGVNNIDVSWYGGEPLLYVEIVESLSKRLTEVANINRCNLKMHMVTNGYLLTPKIIELLDEIGITKLQITIDGLKEHHDKSRPLRDGRGTYDKIIENLSFFEESPIAVVIRMNVDNSNFADFVKLKDIIKSLGNHNIDIYASPVEDINKDTVNKVSEFMTTNEFEEFTMKLCDDGSLSPEDFSVMDDRYCFCTAETENCYVVDELGNFYKCWDEVGRPEHKCFNILEPEDVNFSIIAKYVADDPFSDSKCKDCKFLPLCFGGCKFQKNNLDKSVCGFTDESLKKYIESAFFTEKIIKEVKKNEGYSESKNNT